MQINNQPSLQPSAIIESPSEVKEGAVYRATVKERVSDNEAILQIRGREQLARFEDGVPASGNRVTIQVSEKNDQMIQVKTIDTDSVKTAGSSQVSNEENILKSLGLSRKESVGLKQAVQILLDKGSPLSKETVQDLKNFMDKAAGTTETKIETVKALANKRLEPTQPQLRAVHEALHGKPLNEVLTDIAKEIDPEFKLESKDPKSTQQPIPKTNATPNPIETAKPVPVPSTENIQTKTPAQSNQLSELVRKSREMVEQEPNLKKAIQQIKEVIIKNPNIDRDLAQKVEKAVSEAEKLQAIGKERLLQALKSAEEQLLRRERGNTVPIQQVRQQFQTESDITKILQKVQELITNNKDIAPETKQDIERLAKQATQLDQAGRERLIKMLQQVETALKQKLQTEMNQKDQLSNKITQPATNLKNPDTTELAKPIEIRPSESINQALKLLQKEPNLLKALEQVQKAISGIPNIDANTNQQIEKAINNARQLQNRGREIAARQQITRELTQIKQDLAKLDPKATLDQTITQYDLDEQLQSLQIHSKDILVTKITQKLAEATHDFRELKREISRNLDNVHRLVETFKNNAYPQAKQMLETAISKLDNAILKSDMMLFTDMRTEKQLMQASSHLAEAKKLLAKGDHAQAGKIVNDVKILVKKLIFKPSEQKIMHFVNKESMALENRTPAQEMLAQYRETARNFTGQEASPRQMFEMVRSLGLNHDSDIAQSLVFHKNDQVAEEQQQNLKAALMRLSQSEDGHSKIAQQAEQALTNLTGQQLLSKSDATGTLQSMFFNLPLLLGGKPENLQVFVNSKNEGQQVDWQNCNLYFLFDTKKLGDVGILLNSTDRNLSITVKNDLPGFKEKMESLAVFTKAKLQEIGYNVSSLSFTRMTPIQTAAIPKGESEEKANTDKPARPVFTEKGMDFKI